MLCYNQGVSDGGIMTKTYRKRDSKHPKFLLIVSEKQLAIIDAAIGDTHRNRNEVVRAALAEYFGNTWPDDLLGIGDHMRKDAPESGG
jgi:hypothetical protein